MRRGASALLVGLACVSGCELDADAPTSPPVVPSAVRVSPSASTTNRSAPPATSSAAAAAPAREVSCTAPSLAATGPLDGRDEAALATCQPPSTGRGQAARSCGAGEVPPIDYERLAASVRPFDDATRTHVREVARRGSEAGRNPRAFGLVGDSMTVSGAFLRGVPRPLDPRLKTSLESAEGESIIDWYAGAEAARLAGRWTDSFGAPRAAKVGARAPWPLVGGTTSPLATLMRVQSPAVAVVLFGGNDAAFTAHKPLADLADRFERDLAAIVDALEAEGVVVVLNTLARHGSAPGVEDCGGTRDLTNWRISVQTNALSARVVEMACRRHLPLIDVRDALDTAVNLGLGPDQIHPSVYAAGSEVLDARSLRCGYNIRNYVTLLMLKRLRDLVFDEDAAGNRSATQ